jgi:hypothetical protein
MTRRPATTLAVVTFVVLVLELTSTRLYASRSASLEPASTQGSHSSGGPHAPRDGARPAPP